MIVWIATKPKAKTILGIRLPYQMNAYCRAIIQSLAVRKYRKNQISIDGYTGMLIMVIFVKDISTL